MPVLRRKKKKSKSQGYIVLGPRDHEIFKLLFRYKLATLEQIKRHIFKLKDATYPRRRVNKLIKYGYIEKESHGAISGIFYYQLLEKGYRVIYQNKDEDFPQQKTLYPPFYYKLLEIGKMLEKCSAVDRIYTENEYQYRYKDKFSKILYRYHDAIQPDLIVGLFHNDKVIYGTVELELIKSGSKNYPQLIDKYYQNTRIDFVFYFYFKESTIINRIQELDKSADKKKFHTIYYIEIEEFLQGNFPLAIKNVSNEIYELI